jgi:tRNA U38,U39,U40 pseudouridine synthase TruA
MKLKKWKLTSESVMEMLKTGERRFNIKTMPAKALVLHKVKYN